MDGNIHTFSATTTGVPKTSNGAAYIPASAAPFATYGIAVKGVGGTLTSWTVTLDGSLDGANWTTLITHNATDGSTSWETTGKPCLFIRVNVSALSLGTATSITVVVVAVP